MPEEPVTRMRIDRTLLLISEKVMYTSLAAHARLMPSATCANSIACNQRGGLMQGCCLLRGKAYALADSDDGGREKRRVSEEVGSTLSTGTVEVAPRSDSGL
jgi:hypothetical protein